MPQRILVIEDNELNLELMITILQRLYPKLEILTASDGLEGWDVFCRERPNIVFLDMQLPHLDGFTLARRIKEAWPSTVVLGVTAYAMAGDRERVLEAGCDGYLAKPVRLADMRGLVEEYASFTATARGPQSLR